MSDNTSTTTATLEQPPDTRSDPYQDPAYHQPPALTQAQGEEVPHLTAAMQACIQDCLDCSQSCSNAAIIHCLEADGPQAEPHRCQPVLDCADLCQTTANFLLANSPFAAVLCGVCAQVCTASAQSCDAIEGTEACAAQCRKCADSCQEMAQTV